MTSIRGCLAALTVAPVLIALVPAAASAGPVSYGVYSDGTAKGTVTANGTSYGTFTANTSQASFQGTVTPGDFGGQLAFDASLLDFSQSGTTVTVTGPSGESVGSSPIFLTAFFANASSLAPEMITLAGTGGESFTLTQNPGQIRFNGSLTDSDPDNGNQLQASISGVLSPTSASYSLAIREYDDQGNTAELISSKSVMDTLTLPVPEPSTAAIVFAGLAGLWLLVRRKQTTLAVG